MIVKLLSEHHLEFLSLIGGCRGSSESTLVKMSNCWKSHAAAHMVCKSVTEIKDHGTNFPNAPRTSGSLSVHQNGVSLVGQWSEGMPATKADIDPGP